MAHEKCQMERTRDFYFMLLCFVIFQKQMFDTRFHILFSRRGREQIL